MIQELKRFFPYSKYNFRKKVTTIVFLILFFVDVTYFTIASLVQNQGVWIGFGVVLVFFVAIPFILTGINTSLCTKQTIANLKQDKQYGQYHFYVDKKVVFQNRGDFITNFLISLSRQLNEQLKTKQLMNQHQKERNIESKAKIMN